MSAEHKQDGICDCDMAGMIIVLPFIAAIIIVVCPPACLWHHNVPLGLVMLVVGRVHIGPVKLTRATAVVCLSMHCRLMSKDEQVQYGVQIGVDYPPPVPAAKFARPHDDGGYRVGGNPSFQGYRGDAARSNGGRGGGGRGRGGGGSSGGSRGKGRGSRPKSNFEMYG